MIKATFILLDQTGTWPLLIFLVIAAVIFCSWFFSRKMKVKRALMKHQQKPIGSFMDGDIATTTGKVVLPAKALNSPMIDRKCSYYYLLVEQYRSNGKSGSWYKLFEEEESGEVIIQDGNHFALIGTTLVSSYILQDKVFNSGFLHDATPRMESILEKHGISSTGLFGANKSIRYKEGALESGEVVVVAGKGEWKPKTKDVGISAARYLFITHPDHEKVYMSDDPDFVRKNETDLS